MRAQNRFVISAILAAVVAGLGWAETIPSTVPEGTWLTEHGDARVRVQSCEEGLCGTIVWMDEPYTDDGRDKLDIYNPDEELRNRRVMGLRILEARKNGERWSGTIYDPDNGKTYRCHVSVAEHGELKLRGYIGISLIGRTTRWTRVLETE